MPPDRNPNTKIVAPVLRWYRHAGRVLPWRGTGDAYRILLSEIMLQQTQVARVLERYPRFLRQFPTLRALSRAERRDVIIAWRGMGYNNRAVRLHRLARIVIEEHDGKLPASEEELLALPGIGKYTARAILSSVHRQPAAVVDVNVRRFYSRVFFCMDAESALCTETAAWRIADRLIPVRRSYDWNQALMDIGSTVCTARRPRCGICPVAGECRSRGGMNVPIPATVRREPGLFGVPNRIYRGRIVELLRSSTPNSALHIDVVGRRILPVYASTHRPWLRRILDGLEADGLIRMRSPRGRASSLVRLA
jgi:A/G-specific adenine glycosylase